MPESINKCISHERFTALEREVKDLRVAVMGDGIRVLGVHTRLTIQESDMDRLQKTLSRAVWLVLATFLTVLGDIVTRGFHH